VTGFHAGQRADVGGGDGDQAGADHDGGRHYRRMKDIMVEPMTG
jgi:hypothetical protein